MKRGRAAISFNTTEIPVALSSSKGPLTAKAEIHRVTGSNPKQSPLRVPQPGAATKKED